MTPEDWITAFMIHLSETGKPMDNWQNNKESKSCLIGAFFSAPSVSIPCAHWRYGDAQVHLESLETKFPDDYVGVRTSVVV